MNNEELFKEYLVSLGMNPEWTELTAVMEIIRNKFSKALKDRQKYLRIRENELIIGKRDDGDVFTPNKINIEQFELGSNEMFIRSPKTGMIEYIKSTAKTNFEKLEIDSETGIVMRHVKRFGGNARDEEDDFCYSIVEYKRTLKDQLSNIKVFIKMMQ